MRFLWVRSRHGGKVFLLLTTVLLACRTPPSPPPAPRSAAWICPPPLAWARGEARPTRLKLTNGTSSLISVYLDQCDGHTRLGSVLPGRTRRLRLPPRLIPFNDQLRVHLFDLETLDPVGIYAVDVEAEWELELDVDAQTPSLRVAHASGQPPARRVRESSGFMTYPGEELSYASRWAEDSPAALTWQCLRGRPRITLTHHGSAEGHLPVSLEFGAGGEPERVEWGVLPGRTTRLLAPEERIPRITERSLADSVLVVTVGGEGAPTRHRFDLSGLAEALTYLPCFPPPAP